MYVANGYLGKIDSTYNEKAVANAVRKITSVYDTYIKGTNAQVYFAIIPDKNYFLAEQHGYPVLDYEKLYEDMQTGLSYMTYIELRDLLTIEDYYRTDLHWKQENILDVAQLLAQRMGMKLNKSYKTVTLDTSLNSIYYGTLPESFMTEKLSYLDHSLFDKCTVYDHQNEREIPIYDLTLAESEVSYDMFLSGSISAITMENPKAKTNRELVIFRDSFGSSIAPLFLEGYKKVTVLDIRYLNENLIEQFVTFENQDVLFLYNTTVLNNRTSFR